MASISNKNDDLDYWIFTIICILLKSVLSILLQYHKLYEQPGQIILIITICATSSPQVIKIYSCSNKEGGALLL